VLSNRWREWPTIYRLVSLSRLHCAAFSMTTTTSELIIVGHGNAVTALAFSADGKILVSGSPDQTVIAWDVETGVMRRLWHVQDFVNSVVLSPDGTTVITDDGHVWDMSTGHLLRKSHRYLAPLACSPDGRLLACATLLPDADSFSLLVTEIRNGRTRHRFAWNQSQPDSVAFSSDGDVLAASSYDHTEGDDSLYLTWTMNLQTGETHTFSHHQPVCLFGVSLEAGVRVVAASVDGRQLWNAETGVALPAVITSNAPRSPSEERCVCLSPDGRLLVVGTDRGIIQVWNIATSECLWQAEAHEDWVQEIAIAPDGRTLATAGEDHTIRLWDAWSGTPGHVLGGRGASVAAVAFHPDGQAITALSADGTARLWRINPPSCERRESGHPGIMTLGAPLESDTARNVWSVSTATLPSDTDFPDGFKVAALSPDGSLVALSRPDRNLLVWNREQRLLELILPVTQNGGGTPTFSPDNRFLATVSEDGRKILVFDIHTGEIRQEFPTEERSFILSEKFAFSHDGQLFAVGHFGFAMTLWNVQTGKCERRWREPRDYISALAFAPDTGVLAVGTAYDTTVWLRNLKRWGRNVRLIGHTDDIRSADFSPDGSRIATGAQDATIRLWDPKRGSLLATFLALPDEAWVISTPQGDYIGSPGVERYLLRRRGAELVPITPER
jgi:WD40 repeat protein